MINTKHTLYEIETALAKSDYFNYIRNIVAFNVNGIGKKLPLWHECDMLVLSKSGYLTEIEIKRSWYDFLADFKKRHKHDSEGIIKNFYYAVPYEISDKVETYINENNIDCNGVVTYAEDLFVQMKLIKKRENKYRKLTMEEQLQVARFGAMRCIKLKEKINALINENNLKEYDKSERINDR